MVSPVPYRHGTTVITLTVSDGLLSTSTSFQVTVTPVNDPPTMLPITSLPALPVNSPPFVVSIEGVGPGRLENGSDTLSISATSDNPELLPDPVVEYTNPDSTGRLTIAPAANRTGIANISVTVDDGVGAANSRFTQTFAVKVYPPVASLPATMVRSRSATVWGSVNPYSNLVQAWFEWATHPTLASTIRTIPGTERATLGPVPNLGGHQASAYQPDGICVGREGNIYTADYINHQIRKISPSGVVCIVAGIPQPGMVDAVGEAARFAYPAGVAVDAAGNLYVADSENNRIRKINPAGMVTTLAGSSPGGFADGLGGQAKFNRPFGVAVDGVGNVFVADTGNNRIRKITPGGLVTTIAGNGQEGFADGPAEAAMFYHPDGVAAAADGTVWISDTLNGRIRRISTAGVVSTLAGTGRGTLPTGTVGGPQLGTPVGLALDLAGNLVVADPSDWFFDSPGEILRIDPWGKVAVLVGGNPPAGVLDTDNKYAYVNAPTGVAVGPDGRIFINDGYFFSVREIKPRYTTAYQTGLTGSSPLAVSSALTGLLPGTTYYYRAVGENSGGPGMGEILSFTTLTALAEWRLDALGAVDAPLDADGDGDGLTNLVEYAFSRDPRQPDRTLLRGPVWDGGGLVWAIPKVAGVLYNVESSPDLTAGSWTSAGLNVELDSPSLLKVRAAATPGAQRFFRTRVSVAP